MGCHFYGRSLISLFLYQVKIKEQPPGRKKPQPDSADDNDEVDDDDDNLEIGRTPLDKKALLEGMVDLVLPGETVARAIQRLGDKGGPKSSGRQRRTWSRLKAEEAEPAEESEPQKPGSPERKEQLERLSGLADQMVARGVYEIYQETREKLALRLRALEHPSAAPTAAEPELDMFAEDIDEAKLGEKTPAGESLHLNAFPFHIDIECIWGVCVFHLSVFSSFYWMIGCLWGNIHCVKWHSLAGTALELEPGWNSVFTGSSWCVHF